jgi:hypothetical protein
VYCTRCWRSFPFKETLQVLKLLKLAARETDNDGKPSNQHVRRTALNKAAHKLAALRLKAIDESELQPTPPPPIPTPPPVYYPATYVTTVSNVGNTIFGFGNFYVRLTLG